MADLPCNQSNLSVWWEMGEAEWDKLFTYTSYIGKLYFPPIMFAMGIPGNIIAFYIWLRPPMRQSSGIYLAALAFANFTNLVIMTMRPFTYLYYVPVGCEIYSYFRNMFKYLSPLLVLGFTTERYISVCHPFKRDKLCTQRRAIITVACMYAGAALIATPLLYFFHLNPRVKECWTRDSIAVTGGLKSIWNIWTWCTEMLLFFSVPSAVLVFNVIVICETQRVMRVAKERMSGTAAKQSATTFTLLMVSFYLIASALPSSVLHCLKPVYGFGMNTSLPCVQAIFDDPKWRSHFIFLDIQELSEIFTLSYYASAFYIYMFTSSKFIREFRVAILGKMGLKIDDNTTTATGTTEWYTKYGANPTRATRRQIREIGSGTSVRSTGIERDVQPEIVWIDDSPRGQEGLETSRPSGTRMAEISLTSLPDGYKTDESGGTSNISFSRKWSTNVDMAMSSPCSDGSLRRYVDMSGSRTSVTSNKYKATSIKQASSNASRGQATKRIISHRRSLGMPTTTTREGDSVKLGRRRRFTVQGDETASRRKHRASLISMSSLNK